VAKRKLNKSQRILEYLGDHPEAKSREVAAALNGSENLNVSAQYVTNVRAKQRVHSIDRSIELAHLIEAKKFVDRVGGLKAAKNLIRALAQLQ
jgi:hypothetical protein